MVVSTVKVFARLKTEPKQKQKFHSYKISKNEDQADIAFCTENENFHNFRFCDIFHEPHTQREIFDVVAKPVVDSVLQGFNGTILAYGQTGSGKTFSMTGSSENYDQRGIIPRSLQHIFAAIEKTEVKPIIYISYLEIYNEICYDLLSPRSGRIARSLEELPRVAVLEDRKSEPHLRNLSVLPVSTEEEAMRLLFLGDTNRTIAETPLNEYSSRSHCIFTVHINSKSEKDIVRSKLNLVDLAGSERVHKSKITGTTLQEAKHINLSLHYLQQVILALSEAKRPHVPYRNSLMTFILKDSLAGNCLTVMLATLSLNRRHILETISTCKFAQRVSLIKLDPVINKLSDPQEEISLLKSEIELLRMELAKAKPQELLQIKSLPEKLKKDLESKLELYLESDAEVNENFGLTAEHYMYCLKLCKNKIASLKKRIKENELAETAELKTIKPTEEQTFHNPDLDYYLKKLSSAYERAKILASVIEECQTNINCIRQKLDIELSSRIKSLLTRELENQQSIYKTSLTNLRELKNETLQLEAGLSKTKTKLRFLNSDNSPQEVKTEFQNPKLAKLQFSESNGPIEIDREYESDLKSCSCYIGNSNNCNFERAHNSCHCLKNCGVTRIYKPYGLYQKKHHFCNEINSCYPQSRICCDNNMQYCQQDFNFEECFCKSHYRMSPNFCDGNIAEIDSSDIQLVPNKLCETNRAATSISREDNESCIVEKADFMPEIQNNNSYEIFLETDSEDFKRFIGTVDLTGDEEVDKEICNFYRGKFLQ